MDLWLCTFVLELLASDLILDVGLVAWDLWLGIFGLGSLALDRWLCICNCLPVAWELWVGILGCGNWFLRPGTWELELQEPSRAAARHFLEKNLQESSRQA